MQTVDAKEGIVLSNLSGSDLCHGLNRVQPTVLSQGHRYYLESICKRPHGILLQGWALRKIRQYSYNIYMRVSVSGGCLFIFL